MDAKKIVDRKLSFMRMKPKIVTKAKPAPAPRVVSKPGTPKTPLSPAVFSPRPGESPQVVEKVEREEVKSELPDAVEDEEGEENGVRDGEDEQNVPVVDLTEDSRRPDRDVKPSPVSRVVDNAEPVRPAQAVQRR
jgi:hypothetical protein